MANAPDVLARATQGLTATARSQADEGCEGSDDHESFVFRFHVDIRIIVDGARIRELKLPDCVLDGFARLSRTFLDPANQLCLLPFEILQIVIGQLRPFLLKFAFENVPVTFDF